MRYKYILHSLSCSLSLTVQRNLLVLGFVTMGMSTLKIFRNNIYTHKHVNLQVLLCLKEGKMFSKIIFEVVTENDL